jgi:hypothetical protein
MLDDVEACLAAGDGAGAVSAAHGGCLRLITLRLWLELDAALAAWPAERHPPAVAAALLAATAAPLAAARLPSRAALAARLPPA